MPLLSDFVYVFLVRNIHVQKEINKKHGTFCHATDLILFSISRTFLNIHQPFGSEFVKSNSYSKRLQLLFFLPQLSVLRVPCFFMNFVLNMNISDQEDIGTGKSLSEALIFASTNPQYDDRLFVELQVQYMKFPSSNLGRTCVQKLFDIHNNFCTQHVLPMFCKKKSF